MKKSLFVLLGGLLLSAPLLFGSARNVSVHAEGEEITEPEVFECSVKLGELKHGVVEFDKLEGHVGEICTLDIKIDTFYILKEIKVNDTVLSISEDGKYKFALVEGENIISGTCVVDPEIAGEISVLIDKAEQATETGDFTDLFTFENVALLINYLMNMGYGIALIVNQIKYSKSKTVDRAEIIGTIQAVVPEKAQEIITDLVEKSITPILDSVNIKCDNLSGSMQKFIQGFMYNLEGTDEAKERVLNLLSNISLADDSTVKEVRQFFEDKIAKLSADYEKRISLLEEMKKSNDEALKVSETGNTEPISETSDVNSLI